MSFAPRSLPRLMLLSLLALACVSSVASAAEPAALTEPRFATVATERELNQNVITALAQDRAGLLWIGISNGLLRHDGVEFVPQRRGTAPDAKAVGQVRALVAARDGRLWVGTESDGVLWLNPQTGAIGEYRADKAHPEGLAPGAQRALAEDRDGGIWIGTVGQGLQRLDPATGKFQQFRKESSGLPDDRIQSLLVDRQGTLWVGSWKGLARRAAGETRFTPVAPQLDGQLIWSLLEASDGRIWAGTRQGGLVQLSPQGQVLAEIDQAPGAGMVFSMAEAGPGRVWVGRIAGIEERDFDGRLLRRYRRDPQRNASLGDDRVQVMKSDPAGGVWVASYGGGLQRHDTHNTSLGVLRNQPNGPHAGEEINARSIVELDNGEIWVGTHTEGVLIFAPDLSLLRSVPAVPGGIGDSGVTALAQARDGSIWLGVDNAATLFHLDRQGRILDRVKAGEGGVRRLLAGRDGTVWAATQDGLYRERFGAIERVKLDGGAPLRGNVNAVLEAPDGALWVGAENGLYRMDPSSETLRKLEAAPDAGLSYPSVVGLLLDHAGQLWLDTAFGLHRLVSWSGSQARFERISDKLGVGGNAFGANLLEDARGRIWTQHAVYDPAQGRVQIPRAGRRRGHGPRLVPRLLQAARRPHALRRQQGLAGRAARRLRALDVSAAAGRNRAEHRRPSAAAGPA
ncbi:two-component regulator propeller domain-containing protein [Burkholderiaceae bacterium UC74_6]